jgi:hypothetical protein
MIDTGFLGGLSGLRLRRRSHEANQRIADGILNRVGGRTVERRDRVDDSFDDDAFPIKCRIVAVASS